MPRLQTDPLPLLFSCGLLLAVLSGCQLTRGPDSKYIAPPYDSKALAVQAEASEMRQDPEVMLTQEREYYIGPGDVLSITLVGREDIFGEREDGGSRLTITVTQDPLITLPLIGAIRVHGKTAEQLRQELESAYSEYIVDPIPIVTIEQFHYNQVSVIGSVNEPGRYPLEFGDTLLDMIYRAGGLNFGRETPPARYLEVYREKLNRREKAELPLEELLERIQTGKEIQPREAIVIPIQDLILGGELGYNIPMQPNDIVYIPVAGTVSVQGPVQSPGVIFLGPSLRTVSQVLTAAGGLRFSAASTIEVVRTAEDGSQISYFFDARKIEKRKAEDFLLQDNDQIFIYRHPVRTVVEWIGSVFRASARTGVSATYNPI